MAFYGVVQNTKTAVYRLDFEVVRAELDFEMYYALRLSSAIDRVT